MPGFRPFTLRAVLQTLKIVPDDFLEPVVQIYPHDNHKMVVASGFEPPTPTMSRWCSNQLSYATINQVAYSTLEIELFNWLGAFLLQAFSLIS